MLYWIIHHSIQLYFIQKYLKHICNKYFEAGIEPPLLPREARLHSSWQMNFYKIVLTTSKHKSISLTDSYEERKYSHIEFTLKKYELQSNVIWWGYGVPLMNNITIIGQSYPVGSVYLNGDLCQKPHCEYNFVGKTKTLYIFGISLSLDKPFNVKWSTDYPPEVKHSTKKVLSNFGFGVGWVETVLATRRLRRLFCVLSQNT